MILIPALLGLVGSAQTLMILGLAFTYHIANMAAYSAKFHWLELGDLRIQAGLLAATFLILQVLHRLAGRKFLYFAVIIFFVVNGGGRIAAEYQEQKEILVGDGTSPLPDLVGNRKPASTPNIYLLVYDAYVANETMLEYGIDNGAQEGYLQSQGFDIYPGTYSVAGFTIGTMGRTLDASDQLNGSFRHSVSGSGAVQRLLKKFGYATTGIFYGDFFFQGIGTTYNNSFPAQKPTHMLLTKAIFMGEFRFDVEFDKPTREQFDQVKSEAFSQVPEKARFIYMHDNLPGHSQNSGKCLPNETDLFKERLVQANDRMKEDLGHLLANDPEAIIIVAGDHGPYLTKNCLGTQDKYDISEITRYDVQDRFGTFLAIRWPNSGPSEYDDIAVMQDLFPAVFAFLLEDGKILEAKIPTETQGNEIVSGVVVEDGMIRGGVHDGEPLFLNGR